MKRFLLMAAFPAFVLPANAERIDPKFTKFWNALREAVLKRDKEAVADMTRLPSQMNGNDTGVND